MNSITILTLAKTKLFTEPIKIHLKDRNLMCKTYSHLLDHKHIIISQTHVHIRFLLIVSLNIRLKLMIIESQIKPLDSL